MRSGTAPPHVAVGRQLALNRLRHEPRQGSINPKRLRAAVDEQDGLKVLQAEDAIALLLCERRLHSFSALVA